MLAHCRWVTSRKLRGAQFVRTAEASRMKMLSNWVASAVIVAASTAAMTAYAADSGKNAVLDVWPAGTQASAPATQQVEGSIDVVDPRFKDGDTIVWNVTHPTLEVVRPKGKANGAAIIIAPGGGFRVLSYANEGTRVATFLAAKGYTAFVLKYHLHALPNDPAEVKKMAEGMGRPPGGAAPAPCQATPRSPPLLQSARTLSASSTPACEIRFQAAPRQPSWLRRPTIRLQPECLTCLRAGSKPDRRRRYTCTPRVSMGSARTSKDCPSTAGSTHFMRGSCSRALRSKAPSLLSVVGGVSNFCRRRDRAVARNPHLSKSAFSLPRGRHILR